jgi:glycosyltransferase involved in cell wall biosynthesis
MSKRPTLALTVICKNEEKHVERFCKSFEGIWDQLVVVDTGSTDKTVELFKKHGAEVHTFPWIFDFAAARNETLKHIKTDYWMWADLDDALHDKETFLKFRDTLMSQGDLWLATYNYAHNERGESTCTFTRERVIKHNRDAKWQYFCHEGVQVGPTTKALLAQGWAINHQRTDADLLADKGRNLKIFEHHGVDKMDSRMLYYYGKELFEAGRVKESIGVLLRANQKPDLEKHDRIMCIQYAAFGLLQDNKNIETIDLCSNGLLMDPMRAEYWVLSADAYLKMNKLREALPYFHAAKACEKHAEQVSVIFRHKDAYGPYPRNQIARIYFNLQYFEEAKTEIAECLRLYPKDAEAKAISDQIAIEEKRIFGFKEARPCNDIVISCPLNLYEWDEELEFDKGFGGSETAAIEMAKSLRKLSGRKVLIFNQVKQPKMTRSGVQYMPVAMMQDYFSQNKPALHIAWRHNYKLTDAPTYLWSHDLITPALEQVDTYTKYLCLSQFHKNYVHAASNIPLDKLVVTRNGIRPHMFGDVKEKNPNKFVWVSSPDRGLEHAVAVLNLVRIEYPEIELHVFYGLDNMRRGGQGEAADKYEALIKANPWIKMHGNTQQKALLEQYADAAFWLYPTNFYETFCLSALETAGMGVCPIYRKYGALPETLAHVTGAIEVDQNIESMADMVTWSNIVIRAIQEKAWQKVKVPPLETLSWDAVAGEWIENFLK